VSLLRIAAAFSLVVLVTVPATAAKVDPLLPDAANTVAFVNVRQMVDLPPAKLHAEAMLAFVLQLSPTAQQELEALGIRPLEDIDTLTVALERADRRTLIVRGKFDPDKIASSAERLAARSPERIKPVKAGDVTVWEQRIGRDTVFSTVVDGRALLLSWSLDRVVAAAKGKVLEPKLGRKMQDLLANMNDRQSVWVVVGEPRELIEGILQKTLNPLELPIRPLLLRRLERPSQRIGAVTCSVGIDKEINLSGMLRTEDREVAALLAEVLGESRALRLLIAANPLLGRERGAALADVFADTRIKADKSDLTFEVQFASEKLTRIMTPPKP
jgi:hypothetical protein